MHRKAASRLALMGVMALSVLARAQPDADPLSFVQAGTLAADGPAVRVRRSCDPVVALL